MGEKASKLSLEVTVGFSCKNGSIKECTMTTVRSDVQQNWGRGELVVGGKVVRALVIEKGIISSIDD